MPKMSYAYHQRKRHNGRKYSDEKIALMESMRARGMTFAQIAIELNTRKKDIEQQLGKFGSVVDMRVLKVPNIDVGWRFEDVC